MAGNGVTSSLGSDGSLNVSSLVMRMTVSKIDLKDRQPRHIKKAPSRSFPLKGRTKASEKKRVGSVFFSLGGRAREPAGQVHQADRRSIAR